MSPRCDPHHFVAVTASTYPDWVHTQRQVVDFALRRRSVLAAVSAGRTGLDEVCDAGPYLLQAAQFHGRPGEAYCPICRREPVTLVSWVFGERLGQVSGSARTIEELERLAASQEEFTVHEVEVCRSCRWNHLVRSYVLGRVPEPRGTRRRRRSAGS